MIEINRVAKVVKGVALLVHRAGRDRRRGRPRRRRLRQGARGAARDLEGRRRREEEPLHRAQARHHRHPRDPRCVRRRARLHPAGLGGNRRHRRRRRARGARARRIRDVLAKSLGTTNPINMAKATVNGLQNLRRPEDVAKMRGKTDHRGAALPRTCQGGARRRGGGRRSCARDRRGDDRGRGDRVEADAGKSAIGQNPANRGTLGSLGLGRIGQTNELKDSPELQGKLRKVAHLVRVEGTRWST